MRERDGARLRELLGIILGWSELLRTGRLRGPEAAYAVDAIARNARLQAELIDELSSRRLRRRRVS